RLRARDEPKRRELLRLCCDEAQEVPLRHERQKTCAAAKRGEVDGVDAVAAEHDIQPLQFVVRQREKRLGQTQLTQQVDGGRVDGVTAKVAQEVVVLLEYDHLDACARQQQPGHEPCGPSPRDATRGVDRAGIHDAYSSEACAANSARPSTSDSVVLDSAITSTDNPAALASKAVRGPIQATMV